MSGNNGWLKSEQIEAIETALGYKFIDQKRLRQALTHRSATPQNSRSDYERLEFLGDAVLDLGVADLLLNTHPKAKEGELSKMRAAIVNTASLAEVAEEIQINGHIKLSRAESANNGASRPSILADVIEALIGAVYQDGGYEAALKIISSLFKNKVETVEPRDPKTELQELVHTFSKETPEYLLISVEGPEHEPKFTSQVKLNGRVLGEGTALTKKKSQQCAAEEALTVLEKERDEEQAQVS